MPEIFWRSTVSNGREVCRVVNQSPDRVMANLQLLLFHHSCSQVRKRKFQLVLR